MFMAMNRFRIAVGREDDFEASWRNRNSYLDDVQGFREFNLLRGPTSDGATLFVSHSKWDSRETFEAWTESEVFRKAHAQVAARGECGGIPAFVCTARGGPEVSPLLRWAHHEDLDSERIAERAECAALAVRTPEIRSDVCESDAGGVARD